MQMCEVWEVLEQEERCGLSQEELSSQPSCPRADTQYASLSQGVCRRDVGARWL